MKYPLHPLSPLNIFGIPIEPLSSHGKSRHFMVALNVAYSRTIHGCKETKQFHLTVGAGWLRGAASLTRLFVFVGGAFLCRLPTDDYYFIKPHCEFILYYQTKPKPSATRL